MSAQTELYSSSVFDCKADVVVIPRSTGGTIGARFSDRLNEWGLDGKGQDKSEIGTLQYADINEILPPKRRSSSGIPFTGIAFATSVYENTSLYSAIRQIGQALGYLTTKNEQIRSIATPILGSGAGGLDKQLAYSVLAAAFLESAVDGARLLVAVPEEQDYKSLYLMEGYSSQLAMKGSVDIIKDFFWCTDIAESKEFYFDLATKKLAAFKAFIPANVEPKQFYPGILAQIKNEKRSFQELLNLYPDKSQEHAFLLLTGQLIAHIDAHAYNKNLWNGYSDKRTLGRSTVRQNIWLQHLVQYKMSLQGARTPATIINALRFLEHPERELSMMSDTHRDLLMKSLFGRPYEGDLAEVFRFFGSIIACVNNNNRGALYTAILYSEQVIRIWLPADEQDDELSIARPVTPEVPEETLTRLVDKMSSKIRRKEQPPETEVATELGLPPPPVKSSFGLLSEITSHDLLDYKVYAHVIVKFIKDPTTKAPVTIGIFAPWGRGKTTLMKFIQKELEEYRSAVKPAENSSENEGEPNLGTSYKMLGQWIRHLTMGPADLPRLDNPVVWLNAWKFQKSEEVWSGFAYEIIRQLIKKLKPIDQERFWFFLNLKRVDRREIADKIMFRLINKLIKNSWYFILAAIGAAGLLFRTLHYGPFWGLPYLNWGGIVAGLGGALTALTVRFQKLQATKLDFDLAKYVHAPNYKEQMGLFHSVEEDLKKALELLVSQKNPAVIIVDDLDRCSPKIVAEVIEAINLFISGDFPDCYFVLGQDAQMVTASLDAAYKDIAGKTTYVQKNYGSLGWYFIEKFIQLPFTIPSISKTQSERLLQRWLGSLDGVELKANETLEKARADLEVKLGQTSSSLEALIKLLPEVNEITARLSLEQPDEVIRIKNRILDQAADILVQDRGEIINLIELYGKYLGNSPRTIKRFSNLYRFQRLLQFAGRSNKLTALDTQVIARWVVVMIRWPQLLRCIQWDTSEVFFAGVTPEDRVREFEESFLNKTSFSEWKAVLPPGTEPVSWLVDSHLFEFMVKTNSSNGSLSEAVAIGFW